MLRHAAQFFGIILALVVLTGCAATKQAAVTGATANPAVKLSGEAMYTLYSVSFRLDYWEEVGGTIRGEYSMEPRFLPRPTNVAVRGRWINGELVLNAPSLAYSEIRIREVGSEFVGTFRALVPGSQNGGELRLKRTN